MKQVVKTLVVYMGIALTGSICAAATPDVPADSNAGTILNQSREFFRRQEIARELEAGKAKVKEGADVPPDEAKQDSTPDIRFVLQDVHFSASDILTTAELKKTTEPYLGQAVTITDLYRLVEAINALYRQKGYVTCRAALPPQKIAKGVVVIELWEGKVGQVKVVQNATTDSRYITDRLPLASGRISNLDELNRQLLWFNGTNDVQLRIQLQAGEKPGTTDYIIAASEPAREQFSLFADNSGSETSGLWREGLTYSNRSVSGQRDQLMIGTMFSEGTKSGSLSYSRPMNARGLRLGMNYSANRVNIISGPLSQLDTTGQSQAYGLSVTQPLHIAKESRSEAGLEWSRQSSQTEFRGIRWVDDVINHYNLWVTATQYGSNQVLYQKHSYTFGTWKNIDHDTKQYQKYQFSGLGQQMYQHGQILTLRLNAQISGTHYLPSAEQFYIGGVYSVRGYRENLLGADNGYSMTVEYTMPAPQNREWFLFLDGGSVTGDNAFDDHTLVGAGIGYRQNVAKNMMASLTLGVPLKKELNGEPVDSVRWHFMLNGQI